MSDFDGNSKQTIDRGYDTKAIHAGQEYDRWSNLEIVPPIVTSMNFYRHEPTSDTVTSDPPHVVSQIHFQV